jgi:hypothetical protein
MKECSLSFILRIILILLNFLIESCSTYSKKGDKTKYFFVFHLEASMTLTYFIQNMLITYNSIRRDDSPS